MKKSLLTLAFVLGAFITVSAQDNTSNSALAKGSWLVEANTNFGAAHASNTSFSLRTTDDYTDWNVGFEGGYFVADDLAIKAGLGYGDNDITDGHFSYKVGAKYYIASQFPVQADFNGSTGNDYSPLFLGLQGGYAWFVADNVALEPGIRYDFDINDDANGNNGLSLNIGFSLFF